MLRCLKSLGLVALIAATAVVASPAHAGSPTSNADNSHEYNAYVNGYISMVFADALEASTYNDWQNANSNANGFYSQWFWADQTAQFADAGFRKCYSSLTKDTDSLWDNAADDFEVALDACDVLLMSMAMNGASSSRIQSAESLRNYLELAKDASDAAFAASNSGRGNTLPGFPGRP